MNCHLLLVGLVSFVVLDLFPIPLEVATGLLNAQNCIEAVTENLMANYGVRNLTLTRGKGTRVWDETGREYLDFLAGISVNNLGHCPDAIVQALSRQAAELMHCSNLYLIPQQAELARRLCDLCFADKAFFANSGAEANEGAIKLARLYSKTRHGDDRYEIITVRNSFHGRTLATLTATGQDKVQKGFDPLPVGFSYGEFNDLNSILGKVTHRTCAIMVEPVQGEGGVAPATQEFLTGLRQICDEKSLLLIFDEIQCGMGRCGKMFAHQHYGIKPDIMTLAKALGNGFPIGAMLARAEVAEVLQAGSHGSTFGGNPMACAVALAVLDEFSANDIPERARKMGEYFTAKLRSELGELPVVKEVRGLGLMVGIVLNAPGAEIVKQCQAEGVLINCAAGNVLRLLPPLTCLESECDQVAELLKKLLAEHAVEEVLA
jgi:predicted acetylornithine/succinylornithine family transaminase